MNEHDTEIKATPTEMLASLLKTIPQIFVGARVVPEIAEARMAICMGCEHLILESKRCSVCGCFMEKKVYLASVSCPDKPKRWDALRRPLF